MKGLSRKRTAAVLAVGLCLCLAPGCGGQTEENAKEELTESSLITVGFSQLGNESDWRVANTESVKETFTEENGYNLLVEDAQQKQENQITTIRNFILLEVDYIVIAPVVETGWDEVLSEAKEAGVPVIVMDRQVDVEDDSLYTAWVGSDMYAEGKLAVDWLSDYLEAQGRQEEDISIVHIQGTLGSSAQIGRTEGLDEGLKTHENWHLAAREVGEFTQAKACEVMREILEEVGDDIDVLYCENDSEAFGAMQALDEAGITYGEGGDVILISFDATEAGLRACMEGEMNVNVECNPLHGPRVEEIIRQLEAGEEPEKEEYVEETLFEPEDLTEEFISARGY
ncbi:MAG: ABC transporter substrate-binding protein [Clostridiales bacterium]|nr:ABC transporter substrate-binding protein [Clostridiales bacterium]